MNTLIELFVTFFKIGLVSFGGGYAMIPVIQGELQMHHWLNPKQFTDIVAVSAMAPGPVAANTASMAGFKLVNFPGAVVACLAVTLPSLLLILIIGKFFSKFNEHPWVKAAFYGLRPTIVGIIAYASIKFALGNGIIGGDSLIDIKSVIILIVSLFVLLKTKFHPVFLILASGIAGIILFG